MKRKRYQNRGNNTYPTFTNVATIIAAEVKSTAAMGLKRICSVRPVPVKLQVFITLKAKFKEVNNFKIINLIVFKLHQIIVVFLILQKKKKIPNPFRAFTKAIGMKGTPQESML